MGNDLYAQRLRLVSGSMEYTVSAVAVTDPNGVVSEPSGSIIRSQDGEIWVSTGGTNWVKTGPGAFTGLSGTINARIVDLSGTIDSAVKTSFTSLQTGGSASIAGAFGSLQAGSTASIGATYTAILVGTSASDAAVQTSLKAGTTASLQQYYTTILAGTSASDGAVQVSLKAGTTASLQQYYTTILTGASASLAGAYTSLQAGSTASVVAAYTVLQSGITGSSNAIYTAIMAGTSASDAAVQTSLKAGVTASLQQYYTAILAGTSASDGAYYSTVLAGTSASDGTYYATVLTGVTASIGSLSGTINARVVDLSGTIDSRLNNWNYSNIAVTGNLVVTGHITGSGQLAIIGSANNVNVINGETRLYGGTYSSHFNYVGSANRDTYIRAGLVSGTIAIGDVNLGVVQLGSANNLTRANGNLQSLGDFRAVGSTTGSGDATFGRHLSVGGNVTLGSTTTNSHTVNGPVQVNSPGAGNIPPYRSKVGTEIWGEGIYDDGTYRWYHHNGSSWNESARLSRGGDLLLNASLTASGDVKFSRHLSAPGNIDILGTNAYLRLWDFDGDAASMQIISRDFTTMFWQGGVALGQWANGAVPAAYQATGMLLVQKDGTIQGSLTGSGAARFQDKLAVKMTPTASLDVSGTARFQTPKGTDALVFGSDVRQWSFKPTSDDKLQLIQYSGIMGTSGTVKMSFPPFATIVHEDFQVDGNFQVADFTMSGVLSVNGTTGATDQVLTYKGGRAVWGPGFGSAELTGTTADLYVQGSITGSGEVHFANRLFVGPTVKDLVSMIMVSGTKGDGLRIINGTGISNRNSYGIDVKQGGGISTSAGEYFSIGVSSMVNSIRVGSLNRLYNVGVFADATGAQTNVAIYADRGENWLNGPSYFGSSLDVTGLLSAWGGLGVEGSITGSVTRLIQAGDNRVGPWTYGPTLYVFQTGTYDMSSAGYATAIQGTSAPGRSAGGNVLVNVGVHGQAANSPSVNIGVYGSATGSTAGTNYGGYFEATTATSANWAVYAQGPVFITGKTSVTDSVDVSVAVSASAYAVSTTPARLYIGRQIFTGSAGGTAATYTPTPGTKAILVKMVGAGGGGGGVSSAGTAAAGGAGGNSGTYWERWFSSITSTTGSVRVGSGGAGGVNTGGTGGTGGVTTFAINATTYLAAGGVGGTGATRGTNVFAAAPAANAASSTGDVVTFGNGSPGVSFQGGSGQWYYSGMGGSNPLGLGGGVAGGESAGKAGTGAGGGGGGASTGLASGFVGGSGAHGVVIVEEYG